jgi:hypothetical protein
VIDDNTRGAKMQRRSVLKSGALLALVYAIDGVPTLLTPAQAHAQNVAPKVLSGAERDTLEAIGEVLVPGARTAGIAQYVDHQLGVDFGDCLLGARVLDIAPPIAAFYHVALASIDTAARRVGAGAFGALKPDDRIALVRSMSQKNPEGWTGPPAPFVYFVLRSDAIDVTYGTVEAYQRMGVPYMPHVLPPQKW